MKTILAIAIALVAAACSGDGGDGQLSAGRLLGVATLSWTQPTKNVDGTDLTDIAGYRITYGLSASALSSAIDVGPVLTADITGLQPGATYWFRVSTLNSAGEASAPTQAVSAVATVP